MYVINLEMPHESESGGAGGSPTHAPSPPRAAHALPPADTFHQQIMQSQSPRKNHIAERAKQSLENSFLIQLKKQQQLQQEILLQHFQQQRQQLAEQHEQQLRHHLKLWEQQKALEEAALREAREAREARERHERDAVRKRDKHDHSANASTQVKQKLQEFLKKKQAAACANGTVPGSPYRNWGIVKSSSGESITSPPAPAHPYRLAAPPLPALHPPSADFPLRKTASEPNMLKVRLKARVIERRASPLARRPLKCRLKRNMEGGSPRGSPPGGASAPIREEEEGGARPELLFSSPSLPNISLGRPAAPAPLPPLREGSPGRARPLGRTHSAPLPLGDPALAPHALRDHIRRTVLTRAHPPPHPPHEEEPEVMDLTARAAPLARALSSPLVGAGGAGGARPRTGLAYDPVMLKHGCACGARAPAHPEHAGRLQSVWARLAETGLAARAARVRARRASPEELGAVHAAAHVAQWAGRGAVRALARLPCGGLGADADTAWSEAHTPTAARAAAGLVLELATRIASGDLHNGFAAVRPPGHHAEHNQAMGFCFFNSVAMTARLLHTRHNLQRILIVDWDVHHGNGTQQMFYESSNVLYISLHRHDDGNFFPGTGAAAETGAGAGAGHTVNVAWNGSLDPPMGDAEYLAAFRTVVMPIAKEYAPEIVLVSCGFDAAAGHAAPLGGYLVSAACFAAMTRSLLALAGGRVLLALEGGYELRALCDAAAASVRALLGEPVELPAAAELARPPAPAAQRALRAVHAAHQHYWPVLKRYTDLIGVSALEAGAGVCESATPLAGGAGGAGAALVGAGVAGAWRSAQSERDADNTVAAMATLSVHALRSPESSRSVSEEPMEQDDAK